LARGRHEVQLDLRPISSLKPHEETIESSTREMVAHLQKDGVQKDPIIVDAATGVILDGMHRLEAFRNLRVGFAVCNLVDYGAASIRLGRWLRFYRPAAEGQANALLSELGMRRKSSASDALNKLEKKKAYAAVFIGTAAFTTSGDGDSQESFELVRKADAFAQSRGWTRTFEREEELGRVARESSGVALLVARFEKTDVTNAGMTGHLLPCKTSMHFVDPRPVAINTPIDDLRKGSRESLDRILDQERFEMLPPDSVYEGRRYKERLLLLSRR